MDRFFRKLDWSAFWTAFAVSFVVYFATMAPTVSLEDSGELAVAGDYLGVPHPPGYPIWTMLSFFFTKIFAFIRFRGQPNPAWSIALLSVVFASLAAAVTALLICRSGADLVRESRGTLHNASQGTENAICWIGGVVSSLLFAFSPAEWSQSVIVEVYSLNAFFLVLVFLLTYWWLCRPSARLLWATGFVFGLGLTNYQVLLLAALPLAILILLRDMRLFRDFLIAGLPFVIVIALIKAGKLPNISHPGHVSCFVYVFLNFAVLTAAHFLLPNGKTVALTILMAELGLAFYVYMPIVSDLRNPPMNWAYPRTWEGFKHAITRGQYERIKPGDALSARFIHQIAAYLIDLRMQFTLLAAPLAMLPFTVWQVKLGKRRAQMLGVAAVVCGLAVVIAMAEKFLLPAGTVAGPIYKALFLIVVAIQSIGILSIFAIQIRELVLKVSGRLHATTSERLTVGLVLLWMVGAVMGYVYLLSGKIVAVTVPLREAGKTISGESAQAIVVEATVFGIMIALPFLLAGLVAWLTLDRRVGFRMTIEHNSQKWALGIMAGFFVMSFMLIVLANPKGDIQDWFIHRVKFISSHALYAFWMGYGLIFALVFVDRLLRKHALLKWLSLGTAALLPVVPIHQNYYNRELIRLSGGAEQNGHDFGWQFGNYQLRGADAVGEELNPEEEPLPNPCFPPEMTQDAVFYGGTDPGRFVPTYMIYSARVREDVYLITQNALADNTYMNVMRDLYGDQIWIPAQKDSAKAFQRYVEEVNSGKRPRNAQLKIENGRVQVSGALGVMEINGILAKMIFEHNNFRHDFYVEESYVIRWMYPYLTPHGLIMKINSKHTPLDAVTVRNDLDFWDWYTRRLHSSRKFTRDVVARKSFSKLRSAIGGLYRSRAKFGEAENAFQQARLLYPLSPEANFRLVQEVFMPVRRFKEARELMAWFHEEDPANTKVDQFLAQLSGVEKLYKEIEVLEAEMRSKGQVDVNKALNLASLYQKVGQVPRFMNMANGIMRNTNLPPIVHFRLAQLYDKAGKTEDMLKALDLSVGRFPANTPANVFLAITRLYAKAKRPDKMLLGMDGYLKRKPEDWRGWLDMAAILIGFRRNDEASKALDHAVRHGGNEAMSVIQKDKRFAPFRKRAAPANPNLMGLPSAAMQRVGPLQP